MATLARAERPMAVDDAGTLARGGAKLESGWSRDDAARGLDGALGYAPIENLELELSLGRSRDRGASPHDTIKAVGGALKWVPLQSEAGLSAGLKYEYENARAKWGDDVQVHALKALLTWRFAAGPSVHANLGQEWARVQGGKDSADRVWGLGLDLPLVERLHLTLETFGSESTRPDRQVGLRYEIVENVKLSGAIGYGNDRPIANLGLAWEF